MKFNEELIGKLQEYYNNKNTRFSLFIVEVTVNPLLNTNLKYIKNYKY